MRLYITRHAQPAPGRAGHRELTELGAKQARQLGRRLADDGFTGTVYCSPFRRTVETADEICEQTGGTFYPEQKLHEGAGEWVHDIDGLTLAEIQRQYRFCAHDAEPLPDPWTPETEESTDDIRARITEFFDSRLDGATEDLLLVTHGGPSGVAVDLLCGEQVESRVTGNTGYNLHYNTGLTAIDMAGTPALVFGNETTHLSSGQVTSNSTVIE